MTKRQIDRHFKKTLPAMVKKFWKELDKLDISYEEIVERIEKGFALDTHLLVLLELAREWKEAK